MLITNKFMKIKNKKKKAAFYGQGSTASRLMPLRGGSWLFTTKSPEVPGTHSIGIEEEKSGKAKTFKFLTIEKHILPVGSRIKSSHGKWQVGLLIEHSSAIVLDSWYEHLIKWLPVQIIVFVENGANWKHKYHWISL